MASLTSRLTSELDSTLVSVGFKFSSQRMIYLRKTPYGFDNFLWISHPSVGANESLGQELSLIVGVRHDLVDSLVNQLDLVHGIENQKLTTTVSCPLHLFPPTTDRRYTFFLPNQSSAFEVSSVTEEIKHVFQTDALSFYQRYASLQDCALGLNTDLGSRTHHLCNNYERRMYSGIASAYLSNLPNASSLLELWLEHGAGLVPSSAWAKAKGRVEKLVNLVSTKSL